MLTDWQFPCMMREAVDLPVMSAEFSRLQLALGRLNERRGAPSIPVLGLRTSALDCIPGAVWVQGLIGTDRGIALANALEWRGEIHALEDDRSALYRAFDLLDTDSDAWRRHCCIELARMLCPFEAQGASPMHLWLSIDELSRSLSPLPEGVRAQDFQPEISFGPGKDYRVRCLMTHRDSLFRVLLVRGWDGTIQMDTAEFLAELPPTGLEIGAYGWLYRNSSVPFTGNRIECHE